MCGIVGIVEWRGGERGPLEQMTDSLSHRGPDDRGVNWYRVGNCEVGFGHRRLAILDLSPEGHQPMEFQQLALVFNGEVYNFGEIREGLEGEGYRFRSHSDTEVILKSFHRWGIEAVHKFNGMFAMALLDRQRGRLFLIRDRAGVKPLYYYFDGVRFIFASEIKAILAHPAVKRELNPAGVSAFFQLGYIPEPLSVFQNIFKLRAGHYLVLDLKSAQFEELEYWSPFRAYRLPPLPISDREAVEELERLLISAYSYRLVADVEVGLFLSGGYDSGSVAAILQAHSPRPIKTFTIGFKEDGFDEAPAARQIANYLQTDHTEYYCTEREALEIVPQLPQIYDEPFGDSSAIPTLLVSKIARERVKVALSADGGDEVFGGYPKHLLTLSYWNRFSKLPLRSLLSRLLEGVDPSSLPLLPNRLYNFETRYRKVQALLSTHTIGEYLKIVSSHFTPSQLNRLLTPPFRVEEGSSIGENFYREEGPTLLAKMLGVDYRTYLLDDILVKVDRATMAVSLEGREPLLDYRIWEFMARLPDRFKIRNGEQKWLLRQVVYKYLPREMMERPKRGFSIPLGRWLKGELKPYLDYHLSPAQLEKVGVLSPSEVERLKKGFEEGKPENPSKLWFMFIFQMWAERWL